MDKKGTGKVSLRYFIEYAMKCYAEEKKPWAFVDDPKFLEVARADAEDGGEKKPKKKKKEQKEKEEDAWGEEGEGKESKKKKKGK